jgi:hypothetical protein
MGLASKLRSVFNIGNKEEVKSDNRIEFLVNELIEELKKDGKSIGSPDIADGFGAFTVWVFGIGTDEPRINISKLGKWEVRVKPTFKEF